MAPEKEETGEVTLPIRESTASGSGELGKRKQVSASTDESAAKRIKLDKEGWTAFNASEDIPKDVLKVLKDDRQQRHVKLLKESFPCDEPRT